MQITSKQCNQVYVLYNLTCILLYIGQSNSLIYSNYNYR
ncbi:hypothetical protein PAMA110636_08555 [Paenibacillus macerans]